MNDVNGSEPGRHSAEQWNSAAALLEAAFELHVHLGNDRVVVDAEHSRAFEIDEEQVHGGRVGDHGSSLSVGLDTEQICRALVSRSHSTPSNVSCVAVPDLDLHKIRKEVDVRGKAVTIVECRPPWHESLGPEWTRHGVARMKYDDVTNEWTLYWADRSGRWHGFDLIDPGSIDEIPNEIELDQTGIFWG